jgi:hypothetical protein
MNNIIQKCSKLIASTFIAASLMILLLPTSINAEATMINMETASTFGVLAGSAITNTGPTTIQGSAGGDIGLYPGVGEVGDTFPGLADVTYSGSIHLADGVAQQAQTDLLAAYLDAAGQISDETIAADLEGRTLTAGVYTSGSSISLTGTLILDAENDPNAVFIFQAGSTLTTISDSEIILINGAQVCNVFWQVGSSATLGTNSTFVGTIFASESITATTGAIIFGQLLAINGAVTLDSNTITNDACQSAGSLRVTKTVVGEVTDTEQTSFMITVTGPNDYSDQQTIESGSSYTWTNLEVGLYTVSEEALGLEWSVDGTGEYEVVVGEETDVTVTNTFTASEDEELPQTGASQSLLALLLLVAGIFFVSKGK